MNIFRNLKLQPEIWRGLMIETGQNITKHICQLFYVTGDAFEPTGTGVLLRHENRFFLVSAGHVLSHLQKKDLVDAKGQPLKPQIALPNGRDLVMISGYLEVDPGENPDIAVMELDSDTIEALNDYYQFLLFQNVGTDHRPIDKMQYLVAGFPIATTKAVNVNGVIGIKARPIVLSTKYVTNPACGELKKWQEAFLYDRSHVTDSRTGEKIHGPQAKGVSGSGIWNVQFIQDGGLHVSYRLIGIITDHIDYPSNILIGTKIDVITETLRKKFGLNIPESQTIGVAFLK